MRLVRFARKRSFRDEDVGSDHLMGMMTFQARHRKSRKPTQPRIRFDIKKLNDPSVMNAFKASIGCRFAPLAMLVDENTELDSIVTEFNKVVTDTSTER